MVWRTLQGSAAAVVNSPRLSPTLSWPHISSLHRHTQQLQLLHPPSVVVVLSFLMRPAENICSTFLKTSTNYSAIPALSKHHATNSLQQLLRSIKSYKRLKSILNFFSALVKCKSFFLIITMCRRNADGLFFIFNYLIQVFRINYFLLERDVCVL